jgi:hypothetical protein
MKNAAVIVAFVLLLAILWMVPNVISDVILQFERRRPLDAAARARVALAAQYASAMRMKDEDLAGLPPMRRQWAWNLLAAEWGIRGVRGRKRALALQRLDWMRDTGARGNPEFASPPAVDPGPRRRMLLAWDCSRLVFLARLCFFAGYVEEQEAWQYIRAAGWALSSAFDSWSSYGQALLEAHDLWGGQARRELTSATRTLLSKADSPWQTYSWKSAVAA